MLCFPEDVKNLQQERPKYGVEPPSTRHQMLAMVRCIGARVVDEEPDRAVRDGVATLVRTVSTGSVATPPFGKVVAALRRENLSIIQADRGRICCTFLR